MKSITKLLFIPFILFFFLTQSSLAELKLKFVNIDLLIKETKIGKNMLEKINTLDQSNIDKLKLFENELKDLENKIQLKKNIISDDEFQKEIKLLNSKIKSYNNEKNLMVENLKNIKKKELKIFFEKINPIIQNYMSNNSIEMIFNSKNIFIGSKNSDLTKLLIEEINSKI